MKKDKLAIITLVLCAIAAAAILQSQHARPINPAGDEKASEKEKLMSLGYMATTEIKVEDRNKTNITGYDSGKAYPGINLYCTKDTKTAYFMDMDGKVIHAIKGKDSYGCNLAEPYGDDEVLMVVESTGLYMIYWNATIRWENNGAYNHDVAIRDDGGIYAMKLDERIYPPINTEKIIIDESILQLTPDGKLIKNISFADIIEKNPVLKSRVAGKIGDIFHANTLEIIKRDVPADGGTIKKGEILTCARDMNMIAAIDPEKEEITWYWGKGILDGPHQPSMLPNGNILIFDNGQKRNYSRVVEMNPATGKIVWEYRANPPESFYSQYMGGAQRLPNNDTLITEAEKGHAFEVTPEGETVWDFWEPDIKGNMRPTIYRMTRLSGQFNNITSLNAAAGKEVKPSFIGICDDIAETAKADDCRMNVGEKIDNATICDGITDAEMRAGCYESVGESTYNLTLCGMVDDAEKAGSCYETYAVKMKDTDTCGLIKTDTDRTRCIRRLAVITNNTSLCLAGQDESADWCLSQIAEATGNDSLCDKIKNPDHADQCHQTTAEETKNPAICEKITEQVRRIRCKKSLQQAKT